MHRHPTNNQQRRFPDSVRSQTRPIISQLCNYYLLAPSLPLLSSSPQSRSSAKLIIITIIFPLSQDLDRIAKLAQFSQAPKWPISHCLCVSKGDPPSAHSSTTPHFALLHTFIPFDKHFFSFFSSFWLVGSVPTS